MGFMKICVAVVFLSLLVGQASPLYPHEQRRFLGQGLSAKVLKASGRAAGSAPPYTEGHVSQVVDHFNSSDTRTFSQRYLVYDQYWNKKGPVFVYTGNEGDIVWFFQNTGFVVNDLSQHFKALIVFIEHRYYGESLPFGADSYKDAQHLQYLSSRQALADFASVIPQIKTLYNTSNPAIAVGGSYGGMLSAWLRMTHPETVIGSYAASAPIWWFSDLTPCNSASRTITRDFSDVPLPKNCSAIISSVWSEIANTAKKANGLSALSSSFRLCKPLKSMADVDSFMDWLGDTWFNLAMVDYPYAANFLEPLPSWPINDTCLAMYGKLMRSNGDVIEAVAAGVDVYYNSSGEASCFNTSQSATSSLGAAGWAYQACTEMVMPMCSDGGESDMFREVKWDLAQYEEGCMKTFGVKPQPDLVLKLYGGKDISKHSNIIFSNGLLDPWSGGGVLQSVSNSLEAIVLTKGAHHLDLRASQSDDPAELTQVRKKEMNIMARWIEEHYTTDFYF